MSLHICPSDETTSMKLERELQFALVPIRLSPSIHFIFRRAPPRHDVRIHTARTAKSGRRYKREESSRVSFFTPAGADADGLQDPMDGGWWMESGVEHSLTASCDEP